MQTITRAELEGATVELLPSRETLAWINVANITAVNLSLALNTATIGSAALSQANQLLSRASTDTTSQRGRLREGRESPHDPPAPASGTPREAHHEQEPGERRPPTARRRTRAAGGVRGVGFHRAALPGAPRGRPGPASVPPAAPGRRARRRCPFPRPARRRRERGLRARARRGRGGIPGRHQAAADGGARAARGRLARRAAGDRTRRPGGRHARSPRRHRRERRGRRRRRTAAGSHPGRRAHQWRRSRPRRRPPGPPRCWPYARAGPRRPHASCGR